MTNEISTQVEWLVPQIRNYEREQLRLKNEQAILENKFKNSKEYKNYLKISKELIEAGNKEKDLRNEAKQIMFTAWLHDFTTLDWVTVQLNKTPWSLKIEEWFTCPEEYKRIKTEIDKTKLKKDYIDWKFYDDNISIEVDYKLVIKND